MGRIGLEMFLDVRSDIDTRQYHILSELANIRRDFNHNRIYPTLADLVELYTTLRRISRSAGEIRRELPHEIKGIDLEARRIIFESVNLNPRDLQLVEELIEWALPHIQHAIEEGRTIFDFVDEHLEFEEVGIVPSYLEEGYLLVPDIPARMLHVLRYEVSIFTGPDQRYRNLRTQTLHTLPIGTIQRPPSEIKREILGMHRDLPNPATFMVNTELDFPYQETILPVAKRKFMRRFS